MVGGIHAQVQKWALVAWMSSNLNNMWVFRFIGLKSQLYCCRHHLVVVLNLVMKGRVVKTSYKLLNGLTGL